MLKLFEEKHLISICCIYKVAQSDIDKKKSLTE